MMEVIQSDFVRTITTTEAAEKESSKDFLEFNTDQSSMEDEQKLLDKAVQELIELQPACVPKVESYAERVAKREHEIQSLKTALCTLDENGPVQTESADCSTLE